MPTLRQCATCGAALIDDAPGGQCPECLLQLGLDAGIAPAVAAVGASVGLLPREFGDYELLEEIDRGGMGVVYKARQKSLDRHVAVKLILSGHFAGRDSIHRFRTEASAAAALQHPNIVAIHEVGVHQGEHYLAMDWVDGPNFAQFAKNAPLPAPRAARYLKAIAEAIHYAHERGILHRDLKPSNVLIDANDQPRVTDFGLAKRLGVRQSSGAVDEGERVENGPPSAPGIQSESGRGLPHSKTWRTSDSQLSTQDPLSSLTLTGQVLGSPNYIPPEQASGKRGAVTARSDIYSLGAILYHLLTGRGPFVSDTVADTLQQVLYEEPVSPRLLNRSVPRDLETVCLKCLEKEQSRRYATAQELADELDRFLKDEPILARPVSRVEKAWRWCRRKPALASLGAVTILLLLAVAIGSPVAAYRINRSREQAVQAGRQTQRNLVRQYVANGTRLMNDGDLFGSLLWYTEALKLDAGSAQSEEPHRRRIASVLGQCPKQTQLFTHGKVVHDAQFSPDGRDLVTAADDHTARVWDLETGRQRLVLQHSDDVLRATYSPDSRRIVTCSRDGAARIWDATTGADRTGPLPHGAMIKEAVFSPDGGRLATCGKDGTTQLWNAETGERQNPLLRHGLSVCHATFSPDGKLLATAGEQATAVIWDLASGAERLRRPHQSHAGGVAFSPDGRAFLTCEAQDVRVWDSVTFQEKPISPLHYVGADVLSATFSEDGRLILVTSENRFAQVWDVATGRPASSRTAQHNAEVNHAAFSPDSRRFFAVSLDSVVRVWESWTGIGVGPFMRHPAPVKLAAFHPDGRRVLTLCGDQSVRVWDTAVDFIPPTFMPFVDQRHQVTPEGRMIFFGPTNSVCISDSRGEAVQVVLPHIRPATYASFSEDGKMAITACNNDLTSALTRQHMYLWDVTSGRCVSGTNMHRTPDLVYGAFSPDGRRVLTCWKTGGARVWNARTGQPITPVLPHLERVHWGAFVADGNSIITASWDRTVRLWDAHSGRPVTAPLQHANEVVSIRLSADGRFLETASRRHVRQVWDLSTSEPLTPPIDTVYAKEPVVVKSAVETMPEVAPPDRMPLRDLVLLAQTLAASRIDENGNFIPLTEQETGEGWQRLRRLYPDEFRRSPRQAGDWHESQAQRLLMKREIKAGLLHLNHAVRLKPGDAELLEARAQATAEVTGVTIGTVNYRFDRWPTTRQILGRDPNLPANLIDLSSYYNGSLNRDFYDGGMPGLSLGRQLLGGVPFDVRGQIQLSSQAVKSHDPGFPERIEGIRIGRKCERLHFLQARQYGDEAEAQIASYVLHYADGETRELPVWIGRDTGPFWQNLPPSLPKQPGDARAVWVGSSPASITSGGYLTIFKSTRENPRPDVELRGIDFVSSMAFSSPFLVALTVE